MFDIISLEVSDDQKNFVATNLLSLAEAYIAKEERREVFTFGIYDNDKPVGFLMFGYDNAYWETAPKIAKKQYHLWRLMIDKNVQGKGYGKKALKLALQEIRQFPCGKAEFCWLSYEVNNTVARQLYQKNGFYEIEERDGDEIVAILKL
ncbi:GNAT family N-acetyltransferase [Streptococcus marimammalium]|uniref:GNAT family N-acetyltransferase n=1 Tax=Streptococcus marimammalium TaxID=269666 RepID=UPI00035CFCC4|nr:GNAT family N-acetyltransferase [Streptococcus marimammalium]